MESRTLARMVSPLILIAIGVLLTIFDFNVGFINASGRHVFDLLNDALGMLLVTIGVIRLSMLRLGSFNDGVIAGLTGVACIWLVGSVVKQTNPEFFERLETVLPILRIVGMACILLFCIVMRKVCRTNGLTRSEHSWVITISLCAVFYTFTPVILAILPLSIRPEGPLPIFLIALLLATPVFHALVSITRMAWEIPQRSKSGTICGTE